MEKPIEYICDDCGLAIDQEEAELFDGKCMECSIENEEE